jgi:hypothetical protein
VANCPLLSCCFPWLGCLKVLICWFGSVVYVCEIVFGYVLVVYSFVWRRTEEEVMTVGITVADTL